MILRSIKSGFSLFESISRGGSYEAGERRTWMTVGWSKSREGANDEHESNECNCAVLIEPLSDPPSPPVAVEIREAERADPTVKSIEWIRYVGLLLAAS